MPNHVTTICTVTGPEVDVAHFEATHIHDCDDKKGTHFDFDTIVPMPQCVKDTMRPSPFGGEPIPDGVPKESCGDFDIEHCATALLRDGRTLFLLPHERNHLPAHVRRWSDLIAYFKSEKPAVVFWAKRALLCAAMVEVPGWYEWSIANWGTKWGAYAFAARERAEGRLVFKFDTAWSFPEPPFRKLAEMYPTLVFAIVSYDEGSSFACTGEFNGKNDYAKVDATDELYERVYGEKPDREEECENDPAPDLVPALSGGDA